MRRIFCLCLLLLVMWPAFQALSESREIFGPNPALPSPLNNIVPTVNTAKAIGWPKDGKPVPAEGLKVNAYAVGLDHPRWLYILPNGDVLVAETNAPPKPEDGKGIKGWVMGKVMKHAGATVPSANRITLLRDIDMDGTADIRTTFLKDLNSPFGMALIGDTLYVANTDAIVKFPYIMGETAISSPAAKLTDLPAGPINHHWTKNIIASEDGKTIYATVGSNSNVAENGIEAEENRAAIHAVDVETGASRVFATGLRNPNGMGWNPVTHELWTAVNERDELGDNLVPDYMTSVKENGFYGWPYSYFGANIDGRVEPQRPDLVARAIIPDYALGAHTASLGLSFYEGEMLGSHYKDGVFIGQHGSWNRSPRSGYKLIFIPFKNGKPTGMPETILDSFVNEKDEAYGRPVGVAIGKDGAILMADDVGNTIWRVSK